MTLTHAKYAPVASLVLDGYWRERYRVLSHNADETVTIRWETGPSAGEVRTHRTPFEHGRDQILHLCAVGCGRVTPPGAATCGQCLPTERRMIPVTPAKTLIERTWDAAAAANTWRDDFRGAARRDLDLTTNPLTNAEAILADRMRQAGCTVTQALDVLKIARTETR
jgi:hypothetical protein